MCKVSREEFDRFFGCEKPLSRRLGAFLDIGEMEEFAFLVQLFKRLGNIYIIKAGLSGRGIADPNDLTLMTIHYVTHSVPLSADPMAVLGEDIML